MKAKIVKFLSVNIILLSVLVLFQNCGPGFKELSDKILSQSSLSTVTQSSVGVYRIMPLGDSISACCYRGYLFKELKTAGYPIISIGSGHDPYDGDNEAHGGYAVTFLNSPAGAGPMGPNGYYGDSRDLQTWFGPQADTADVVMMQFGTNNCWGGCYIPGILAGYDTVLKAIRAKNPRVTLLIAQILPMDQTKYPGSDVTVLNKEIPLWAARNTTPLSRILVVDQFTGFDLAWTKDGVHPNADQGSIWMSDHFLAVLKTILVK